MAKIGKCTCGAVLKLPESAKETQITCRECGKEVLLRSTNFTPSVTTSDVGINLSPSVPSASRRNIETCATPYTWVRTASTLLFVIGCLLLYGSPMLLSVVIIRIMDTEAVALHHIASIVLVLGAPITGVVLNAASEILAGLANVLTRLNHV